MRRTGAENRFFESTRGQIVSTLRRGPATVNELAHAFGLTPNGVRVHLTSLERDGLVTRGEPQPGNSKPAATYVLAPGADRLFPKPYDLVLEHLLVVLVERLPQETIRDALNEVGHRLAETLPVPDGSLDDRLRHAIDLINELGGIAEVVHEDGVTIFQSQSCPIARAVAGDANACCLAEALLSDVLGVPVQQACDRSEVPHCRFRLSLAPEDREADPR
ncbi:MAG TPA: helix-turn-helix domain-containing protein [Thermomicrobiales bacterium]|nr:helix-turn-helix domain-containing protein [Thermomicrobiales bacterium]